ncbi:hypothetical protein KW805_04600 [Candidatus Pacearchaeota archaeon]|nr:hypothetical protein [Candidatus Pacearchaeota archaeon]
MLSSTVALAAAANYPAPFVQNGAGNVAIVYGSNLPAGSTDLVAVAEIQGYLATQLARQTATGGTSVTGVSVTGEAAPLFTGTKLYVNDSLNAVKTVMTKTELPTVLASGTFSGNVDATYTQTIDIGSNPQVTFAKQPTSSDDPQFGLTLSTSTANYLYNTSVTFNKAINFTHADSKGADMTLFGQKFTVASSTDTTNLVLLKTAEKISLTSDAPSQKVTIGGKEYTIELISASDTSATVRVTASDGTSETKEVNENSSKKVNGITVAVTNADETNLKLSASVIAGAEKVTLTDGSAVAIGEDSKVVDGTKVTLTGGTTATTKITVSTYASDSDHDALLPGQEFVSPTFGTFKIDFASLNEPENSSARENIKIVASGDDKMIVDFMPGYASSNKAIQFAINKSTGSSGFQLQSDSDGHNITVQERRKAFKNDYIVLGNEESGRLLKVQTITNQTSGYNQDKVSMTDVFTGDTYDATLTGEGSGSIVVGGKSYNLIYNGTPSDDSNFVRLNYPDSTGSGDVVLLPTLRTSKGAKVAFYKPINNLSIDDWDGDGTDAATLKFPNGDGYTDVATVAGLNAAGIGMTIGGSALNASLPAVTATVGRFTYNFTYSGPNQTTIYLLSPDGGNIVSPAIQLIEEKDDNSQFHGMVVTLEGAGSGDQGVGVNDVSRTWQNDATWDQITLASNSKISKEADLYGTIVSIDSSDSDQKSTTISYPDEQVYANIYAAEKTADISGGTTSSSGGSVRELGSVLVTDSEASSVSSKNLIVVGGSCVNKVAAELLGGSLCGADFESKTSVGSGSFLIQSFSRSSGAVATLVAGYNAADTVNAARFLDTHTVDTTVGKKYKGSSATSADLVTT